MIDAELITQAICATECSPIALEEGARLAEAYIEEWANEPGEILGVECGWSVQLDDHTFAVGVMDYIGRDQQGIFGRELKTTKEPSRYWSESKWLADIKTGSQIAVYALALSRGVFYEAGRSPIKFGVSTPVRIQVRAAVKSATPMFWPQDQKDSWQAFDERTLNKIADSLRIKGKIIRELRKSGVTPWQLPGKQCTNFNKQCEYFDMCTTYSGPEIVQGFDASDPAAQFALPNLPASANCADSVIISASAYSDYSRCLELGRIKAQTAGREDNLALATGTVFHAALAEWHRQKREC